MRCGSPADGAGGSQGTPPPPSLCVAQLASPSMVCLWHGNDRSLNTQKVLVLSHNVTLTCWLPLEVFKIAYFYKVVGVNHDHSSTSVFYERERQSYTFLLGHWCTKPDGNWHEVGDEKKASKNQEWVLLFGFTSLLLHIFLMWF